MALWRSKGARTDATRGTQPIEVRKSDALVFTRPGVVGGSTVPLVTGTANWNYQVAAAGFVSSRGVSDGAHVYGNDGAALTPNVSVAPGTSGLSRIDVIWVRHPAAGENSDTTSEPEFGVSSGTAASSPVAPSIPSGALELARNTMTSAATSTASAGNTITQTAPYTATRSVVHTRTAAERTALGALATDTNPVLIYHAPAGAGQRLQVGDSSGFRVLRTAPRTLQQATPTGASGSGTGTLGVTSGVTVASSDVNKVVEINFGALFTTFGTGSAEVVLRKDGTAVRTVRITSAASGTGAYSETLTQGTSASYQLVVNGSGGAWVVTSDPRFTYMDVHTSEA